MSFVYYHGGLNTKLLSLLFGNRWIAVKKGLSHVYLPVFIFSLLDYRPNLMTHWISASF